ncbi:MAG: hypothetical protein ACD_20C00419G0019 [uncultured bacterium]|nr:MAG: hypothetical protein ACD_20C00419G0019 [uncultured bacterium]HBH17457.1 hypothetical protein [Cyanobacteria bacterium UBA9579]
MNSANGIQLNLDYMNMQQSSSLELMQALNIYPVSIYSFGNPNTHYNLYNFDNNSVVHKPNPANDGKFSLQEFGRNVTKGALNPFKKFANALIKHPVKTLSIAGIMMGAAALCPPIAVAGVTAGAVGGAFMLGKGMVKTTKNLVKGEYDKAEKSGQDIGEGITTLTLTAIGAKTLQRSINGKTFTKFELSTQGAKTWTQESYQAVKSTMKTDNYATIGNFLKINKEAAINTYKSSPSKGDILTKFNNFRKESLNRIQQYDRNIANKTDLSTIAKAKKYVESGKLDALQTFERNALDRSINNTEEIKNIFNMYKSFLPTNIAKKAKQTMHNDVGFGVQYSADTIYQVIK